MPCFNDKQYFRPDYGSSPFEWEVLPSPHGGSLIRCPAEDSTNKDKKYSYWQTNIHAEKKLCLIGWGDLWETYRFQFLGGQWNIYSIITKQLVCAQDSKLPVHVIANRDQCLEWEMFDIQIVHVD